MEKFIAERKLLYSLKKSDIRKEFFIRVYPPYLVKKGMVDYPVEENFFGCHVEIDGIDEKYSEVYGADTLQALSLASNVEPFLKHLQKKYDLFFTTGEPYFDSIEED